MTEKKEHRAERLKAALRENLRRRKEQARGRAGHPGDGAEDRAGEAQAREPAKE